MVQFNEEKQEKKLEELRKKEEEQLIQILSQKYGIPYTDLTIAPINNDAVLLIPEKIARESHIGVFDEKNKKINVAIFSPNDAKTKTAIENLKTQGYAVSLFMVSQASLESVWARYKETTFTKKTDAGTLDISNIDFEELAKKIRNIDDVKKTLQTEAANQTAQAISHIFAGILAGAIAIDASDIHLEPQMNNVRLRYRLDGVLQDVVLLEIKTYKGLLSRIKLLSGLKLNVEGDTQDGRFSIKIGNLSVEIRTSILPGSYAEAIVLRILNPKSISVPLEDLGIEPHLLEILNNEISKPNGMILNTGPTGSGKTTTLYAFLKKVYSPEIKIITIEDPIEYHIDGISQTQVDKDSNYTFLSGLRAALRQDPDIIMVGEIRDNETAKIAVNSALTGHLVLSTLHTNNAAGAIPRLIDLEINPKVLGSAINASLAQRLVRKLCNSCKTEGIPTAEEAEVIKKVIEKIKEKGRTAPEENRIWRPVGCNDCNGTGYKGRIGIYEAILMDAAVEETLTTNPNEREIRQAAIKQGILDMREDGVVKALNGVTSMEDLERVVDIHKDL